PDFFVYMGESKAVSWGSSHTVWGQLADDASLLVAKSIFQLPTQVPKGGGMRMLNKLLRFNMSVVQH
ncbi:hypothetical protein CYMTET_34582, partial [Cymbomonas tetramitiformis]